MTMRRFHGWSVSVLLLASMACGFSGFAIPALAYQGSVTAKASVSEITRAGLPTEAQRTLELIKQGGPFPYSRDGIPFGNRERILPRRERGYYHEYTVPTPGAKNRGARRIIAGAPGEFYYTDDHYRSFRRIKE